MVFKDKMKMLDNKLKSADKLIRGNKCLDAILVIDSARAYIKEVINKDNDE